MIELAVHEALTAKLRRKYGPSATGYFTQSPRRPYYLAIWLPEGGKVPTVARVSAAGKVLGTVQ